MKKRSIQRVPNMADEDVVTKIQAIPIEEYRAYACFVYLFGNRVSEALGLPKREATGEFYEYNRFSRKGARTVKIPKYTIVPNEWEVEPIRASQIELDEEKDLLWCRGVPTFKTTGRPHRDVWVLVSGPNEKPLAVLLWNYVQSRRLEEDNAVLFNFTRQACYNMFRRYIGVNAFPHKLRDLRATKDATVYGLDAKDLVEKYNWADPKMAMYYGRKNKTDIIAKMRKNL